VAGEFETGVELETLVDLLPEYGPATAEDLAGWIREHPTHAVVSGGLAVDPSASELTPEVDRRERGERYYRAATQLFEKDLQVSRPWLRFLGVTGSTAYGDPREGDDCDLMAVVRPGSVWTFLAYLFLRLRIRRLHGGNSLDPVWCFNYTLDEASAIREFSKPRGFLFAREALVVRPLHGEGFYRGLLRRGEWLQREAPRLYARWEGGVAPEPTEPTPAAFEVRVLNALMFPVLATYLQLKGLWANHRLRHAGLEHTGFRTITRLDRMALATRKFDQLSDRMLAGSRSAPE
jgi:hypothetical protein